VTFLVVAPETSWRLAIWARPNALEGDLKCVREHLVEAASVLGAGAKTAAGYGRLEDPKRRQDATPSGAAPVADPVTRAPTRVPPREPAVRVAPRLGDLVRCRAIPEGRRLRFQPLDGGPTGEAKGVPAGVHLEEGSEVTLQVTGYPSRGEISFQWVSQEDM
jgi:hypothetical protein